MDIPPDIFLTIIITGLGAAVGYGILLDKVDKIEKEFDKLKNVINEDVKNKIINGEKETRREIKELNQKLDNIFDSFEDQVIELNLLEFWAEKQGYEKISVGPKCFIKDKEKNI